MDILGVGPLDLILILILAMVIFGPNRMPEIGARLGQALRSLRLATHEFTTEIDAATSSSEPQPKTTTGLAPSPEPLGTPANPPQTDKTA
jgi:TatA/E family protein of Tat protein translocase